MKKTIKLISVLLILLLLCIVINNNHSKTNQVLKGSFNNNQKEFNTTDALALMYEIDAGSGEYQTSSDTTWPEEGYVFNATLSKCENGGTVNWNEETKSVIVETNVSDKCYVYFDKEPPLLADYIISTYTDGSNGLYYHDANLANGAADNSYRYAGSNPNNYVCFGSDAATCPSDNLYRIIGVFDKQIKLIKVVSKSISKWDSLSNTWDETTKPEIYEKLNVDFFETLDSSWKNLIDHTYKWKVNGVSLTEIDNTPKTIYDYEVGIYQTGYTETMAIGLMYISDYGYAASPDNWVKSLTWADGINDYSNSSNIENNWLSSHSMVSAYGLTISRNKSNSKSTYLIEHNSGLIVSDVTITTASLIQEVRLTKNKFAFYLKPSVLYVSGTGTQSDPFRIS